jgi:hypothetical protein
MAMDILCQVIHPVPQPSWHLLANTMLTVCSLPVGVIAILALAVTIPNGFPHHGSSSRPVVETKQRMFSQRNFQRVDFVGTSLLLAASIILVTAFEEAANGRSWDSALVIAFLVVSVFLWAGFVLWERKTTLKNGRMEPIFPWRFLQSRVCIGMILLVGNNHL